MDKTTKIIIGVVIVAIIIIGGYYFIKGNRQVNKEPIRIGIVLPMTGDVASLGESARAATEAAVDEINNAGGINGRKLLAIAEDSKCAGPSAVSAVQKLIDVDKVSAIVGDICSGSVLAIAPIVEKNKIPLISPCASNPTITNAGDYIFRNYPSDSFQGKFAAEYIKNNLKYSKVAILYIQNDWGNGLIKVFKDTFTTLGGTVTVEESYLSGTKDLRTQLAKIKSVNPEIIYFAGYPEDTISGLKQIKQMGIKSEIFGSDSWTDPDIAAKAGTAAENIKWVNIKTPSAPESLMKILEAKTGKKGEVPQCSLQSYDAVKLLEMTIKNSNVISGEKIKEQLYKTTLSGFSGEVAFDENGDLKTANYEIKTIKNGKMISAE
ncbi:ABC transporter substrate-binding protein [Candidatus Wolfebacteria bacterium]|nr:ABC transporter substrate-binding protein [Candidatus Wolfebacteria bacterium]